jgi:biopolymer transport protein ExbB
MALPVPISTARRLRTPLLALLALLTAAASPATRAADEGEPAPWWDSEWTVRKQVTVTGGAGGAGVTEAVAQPAVLVRLLEGDYQFALAKEDGSDLRFVSADGKTLLPYHFEKYDGLMGEAFAWVKLPEVKVGSPTTFWLYTGNTAGAKAVPVADAKATYDAATSLVYHFSDRGAAPADASGNGNVGAAPGLVSEGAMIGGGLRLDGRGGVAVPASDSLNWGADGFTLSVWVKPSTLAPDAVFFSQGDGVSALTVGLNNGVPYADVTGAAGVQRTATGEALVAGAWRHLALTVTAAQTTLYLDGQPYGSPLAAGLPGLTGPIQLGVPPPADPAATPGLVGEIDELHLSRVARSPSWIKLASALQGPNAAQVLALGVDEAARQGGFLHEALHHMSLFGEISKSLTFDGWVVIFLCAVLALIGLVVGMAKLLYLNKIKKASQAFLEKWEDLSADLSVLDHGDEESIKSMAGHASPKVQQIMKPSPLYHLYQLGSEEIQQRVHSAKNGFKGLSGRSITAIKATLDGGLTREVQRLNSLLVFLTIGIAGGPYLGLFGTVIGVMITFAVIAQSGEVDINSIAPGIAGALLATVAGLAVAIPALFGYSYLASKIKDAVADMQVFIDEFIAKIAECYPETKD